MEKRGKSPKRNILVIGYGSPLRGDDAAGFRVAAELEEEEIPGISCRAVHQLTPELAAVIAQASEVVFVDAAPASGSNFAVSACDLESQTIADRMVSHSCTPQRLLDYAERWYGHCPAAAYIAVPAFDFSLGENLSAGTRQAVDAAKILIKQRIICHA